MDYTGISMTGDDKVRYVLKKEGMNPLVVLGVNPSTADDVSTDRTIARVRGFAERLGFDSFIMLNVYPLRSTKIEHLPSEVDTELHRRNVRQICGEISRMESPTILIAYGNSISRKKYLRACLNDILAQFSTIKSAKFIRLGSLTRKGNPRHPLMCRKDIDIQRYIFK